MPNTRVHLSGREDGGGHVWFERPGGSLTVTKLDAWAKDRGLGADVKGRWTAGIDILRHEHRYTILPPSPHPETGRLYRWSAGRGLNVLPARMPGWLAEMLTRTEAPTPPKADDGYRQSDSIADWFTANHTFAQVLEPHGWQLVTGDGDSDGSEWRHGEATSSVSATVRHGCLFVYSTSTPFEPTEPEAPKGYTPFAAYALLSHANDQSAAASAARRLKQSEVSVGVHQIDQNGSGTHPPAEDPPASQETALQRVDLSALEAFWGQRPVLGQIRDFARARMCSPWAVLGMVLARVAAATPPWVVLPPIVGSHASLNLYVCLVGRSGDGKDAAMSAGRDALEVRGIDFATIGLGSGEGILDQYVEYKAADKASGEPACIEQHTESVLFKNPEIGTIQALKNRTGATLMPMLRDAWMGSELGFAYANKERRLRVGEHKYRMSLVIGCQPSSADILLEEADVGTPQRFLWLPVEDPEAPDELPPEPIIPPWSTRFLSDARAEHGMVTVVLCDEAIEAITTSRRARARGQAADDMPTGHDLLCREKVASLFMLLDGRTVMDLTDWSLAGMVSTLSTTTRERMQGVLNESKRRSNRARAVSEAERQLIVSSTVEDVAVQRVCKRLLSKLTEDWVSTSDLRRSVAHRDRQFYDEAVSRLLSTGHMDTETYDVQGRTVIRYRKHG
jgi:hypothetical protein